MKRCIYGLNDAPHSWYKRVNQEFTNLKGVVSAYDNALFLWHDATGNLMGILAMHIDDFVFCEMICFRKMWSQNWKKIFKARIHQSGKFQFLRLSVRQIKDGITIDQNLYISSISPIDIKKGRFMRKKCWTEPKEEDRIKKTDWSYDVGIHSDTTWCSIWCICVCVCWISNPEKFPKVKLLFETHKALKNWNQGQVP